MTAQELIGDIIWFIILFAPAFLLYWFATDAWGNWKVYLKKKYNSERDRILLEVRVPKEMNKTPTAMELVLNGMHEPSGGDWYTDITTGRDLTVYSFEIVSIGGQVHFYIWCEKNYKQRIEANIYAQYPMAEVVQVPDYTRMIDFNPSVHKVHGFEYKLGQPDPVPIKTFRHMGLDKPGKPEESVDPLNQTIEIMSSIGPKEQMWVQIVARAHTGGKEEHVSGGERFQTFMKLLLAPLFYKKTADVAKAMRAAFVGTKGHDWRKEGEAMVKKIKEGYKDTKGSAESMLKKDKQIIELIQDNMSKMAYEVGIRSIYIAEKDHFNGASVLHMMGALFKSHASSETYNDIRVGVSPSFAYPWQDKSGKISQQIKEDMFKHYRRRAFFNGGDEEYPHGKKSGGTFILSVEELATIYHLPGKVLQTPTFDRIESTTGKAPANLPI